MTNLVITNVYCYLNKGDAGIVIAMLDKLRDKFDNPTIKIISLYPELDKDKYGDDVEVIAPSISVYKKDNGIVKSIRNILTFFVMTIKEKNTLL